MIDGVVRGLRRKRSEEEEQYIYTPDEFQIDKILSYTRFNIIINNDLSRGIQERKKQVYDAFRIFKNEINFFKTYDIMNAESIRRDHKMGMLFDDVMLKNTFTAYSWTS